MFPRLFKSPDLQSFFLFGPRGCGKSTWLKQRFQGCEYLDLLDERLYQDLLMNPELFRLRMNRLAPKSWVVIDEIQRLPNLLNGVHQAIEGLQLKFVLTGSSARKLKRENANMLGGRAIDRRMGPLTAYEMGSSYDIRRSLEVGQLAATVSAPSPKDYLRSYVSTYLREEVQEESLRRGLATFARFLESAAFAQAQVLSVQSIAKDVGVDRKTAEGYFVLLEDLLLARRIPVFQKRAKRKMTTHPKFYFADVGIFRSLRKRGPLDPIDEIEGAAIESLVYQELRSWVDALHLDLEIYFYRTQAKNEVDFVLYGDDGFFAFEVKRGSRVRSDDLSHLRAFKEDYPQAKCYLLYGGELDYRTDEGIEVLSLPLALQNLGTLLGHSIA